MAVHHVDVEEIDVGRDGRDLVTKASEVGCEDGRRNAHRLLHRSEHTQVV